MSDAARRGMIPLALIALFVAFWLGFAVQDITADPDSYSRYCYTTGSENNSASAASGGAFTYTQQAHITCSRNPLPQTP